MHCAFHKATIWHVILICVRICNAWPDNVTNALEMSYLTFFKMEIAELKVTVARILDEISFVSFILRCLVLYKYLWCSTLQGGLGIGCWYKDEHDYFYLKSQQHSDETLVMRRGRQDTSEHRTTLSKGFKVTRQSLLGLRASVERENESGPEAPNQRNTSRDSCRGATRSFDGGSLADSFPCVHNTVLKYKRFSLIYWYILFHFHSTGSLFIYCS
jgi:hypothetical protein